MRKKLWLGMPAVDTDSADKVCRVACKLSALGDLFSFYSAAHDKAALRRDSMSGLSFILCDCTDELVEAVGDRVASGDGV